MLHLQKLSVGTETVEGLAQWQATKRAQTDDGLPRHITRMWPKREAELLDGGSIFWVIKGVMQARQHIVDLRAVVGDDGISRCDIVLEPRIILTEMRPKRPFQGWRYLKANEAPADQRALSDGEGELPAEMRKELAELGLI